MKKKQPFRVWFVGAHAVGKSTLAELTARNYNLPYISEQARIVLAERLQPDFDRLRLDVAETSRYQREVMRRQIATEQQLLHKGYVSDRAFDSLAYAAKHADVATSARRYVSDEASSSLCVLSLRLIKTVCVPSVTCT